MTIEKLIALLEDVQGRIGNAEIDFSAWDALTFHDTGMYIDLEREIVIP